MSDKLPQPTVVLIQRLRRIAKWFDEVAEAGAFDHRDDTRAGLKARANTCLQATARLEELRLRIREKTEAADAVVKDRL